MANDDLTIWTSIPNGIVDQTVKLSVFVTPKLFANDPASKKLGDYPAIHKWPTTIAGQTFSVDVEIAGAVRTFTVGRANKGEFAPDASLWAGLFPETMRVEPIETRQPALVATAARTTVPVYYRTAPLQALVEETFAVRLRHVLSEIENEPVRPTYSAATGTFSVSDRLLNLSFGPNAPLSAQQFAAKDGDSVFFKPATEVTAFFANPGRRAAASALSSDGNAQLTPAQVGEAYTAFCLYHKRGVRNRLHQIRGRKSASRSDPYATYLASDTFDITSADHGKVFEFAESSIQVRMPNLGTADSGFSVVVAYSPNEAIPAPSNDSIAQRAAFAKDLQATKFDTEIVVRAGSDDIKVLARRSKTFSFDGNRWTALDANDLDFHSSLSALGAYPLLLRRLGWIHDLELDLASVFPSFDAGTAVEGRIRVRPIWSNTVANPPAVASPWTHFAAGEKSAKTPQGVSFSSFLARSDPARPMDLLSVGFKDLSKSRSFQYDLDAVLIKTVQKAIQEADQNFAFASPHKIEIPGSPRAASLNMLPAEALIRPKDEGIEIDPANRFAAIRSVGISVFADREYHRFEQAVGADTVRAANLATSVDALAPAGAALTVNPSDVFLNDLVAGYAIDVHESKTARWYSLCQRQVSFSFEGGTLRPYLAPADEGWVSAEAMVEVDENGHKQLRNNENFFKWDGWSLVAENPSNALKEENPGPQDPSAPKNLGLKAKIETLPLSNALCRFGWTYKFRARVKDIAGNAWHPAYADALKADHVATGEITYRRYDPINPPFLVPLQPPGPGTPNTENADKKTAKGPEKAEMLVIRTDTAGGSKPGQWLVLPPDVKFQEAEWIGMFDEFSAPDQAFNVLRLRYCGDLPERFEEGFEHSIKWSNGLLGTPYLPDGHAFGAAFLYLPGKERKPQAAATVANHASSALAGVTEVDFALDLKGPKSGKPFAQPIRLTLRSGARQSRWDASARRLTVDLPPGEQQLFRVSSRPTQQQLADTFGAVHHALNADQQKFLVQPNAEGELGVSNWTSLRQHTDLFIKAILAGQFWPLTPQKNLYLVHAVPQPMMLKDIKGKPFFRFSDEMTVADRVTGSKATVLHDPKLRLHRASCGRLDVYAKWDEYQDGPGLPFPSISSTELPCFSADVDLPDLTTAPNYEPQDPSKPKPQTLDPHTTVDIGRRHEFPTTKHYVSKYWMVGTTRYREYYDAKFTADVNNITIKSDETAGIHILNTTPPPVPDIVFVLPILIWEKQSASKTKVTQTVRRGLRVYMRRNWYASGEGEKLALIFGPKDASADAFSKLAAESDAENQAAVTIWGTNPIWKTKALEKQPTVLDARTEGRFLSVKIPKKPPPAPTVVALAGTGTHTELRLRMSDAQGILAPADEQIVDVAAFEVRCDQNLDLLYADVEFNDIDSYSPLTRLALARFQQHSAPYCHLSPIVRWAFQAVAPNRSITYGVIEEVNESTKSTRQLAFSVGGIAPGDSSDGYRENELEVWLTDGAGSIPTNQLPLRVNNTPSGFRIPLSLVTDLKSPHVHIREIEYLGGQIRGPLLHCTLALHKDLWEK